MGLGDNRQYLRKPIKPGELWNSKQGKKKPTVLGQTYKGRIGLQVGQVEGSS